MNTYKITDKDLEDLISKIVKLQGGDGFGGSQYPDWNCVQRYYKRLISEWAGELKTDESLSDSG